jgi:SAM-dependent methyltransferase
MNLTDVVKRTPVPEPWVEGEKIPWNDPEFSKRMLKYHLSQDHDLASRRFTIIDRHVQFIHRTAGGPTKTLDLGCGPGFYTGRLTTLGHSCTGIDFSPASIEYAKLQAEEAGQEIEYVNGDIRTATYGEGYGLAIMIYGEFNVFREEDIRLVLGKAYDSLRDGGVFIAEPHTHEAVKSFGEAPPTWYSGDHMLFSDQPHIVLTESSWNQEQNATTHRHIVVDTASAEATIHADTMQAYTDEEYRFLLRDAGFTDIELHPSLTGDPDDTDQSHLMVIQGTK